MIFQTKRTSERESERKIKLTFEICDDILIYFEEKERSGALQEILAVFFYWAKRISCSYFLIKSRTTCNTLRSMKRPRIISKKSIFIAPSTSRHAARSKEIAGNGGRKKTLFVSFFFFVIPRRIHRGMYETSWEIVTMEEKQQQKQKQKTLNNKRGRGRKESRFSQEVSFFFKEQHWWKLLMYNAQRLNIFSYQIPKYCLGFARQATKTTKQVEKNTRCPKRQQEGLRCWLKRYNLLAGEKQNQSLIHPVSSLKSVFQTDVFFLWREHTICSFCPEFVFVGCRNAAFCIQVSRLSVNHI